MSRERKLRRRWGMQRSLVDIDKPTVDDISILLQYGVMYGALDDGLKIEALRSARVIGAKGKDKAAAILNLRNLSNNLDKVLV